MRWPLLLGVFTSNIFFSACNCGVVPLSTLTAQIGVEPAALHFGSIPLGFTSSLPVTIRNDGSGTLVVQPTSSDASDFLGPRQNLSIQPGEQLVIQISFSPSEIGSRTGMVHLVSNAENDGDVSIPVAGKGISPQLCGDCSSPPAEQCADGSSLITYDIVGTCLDNQCQYEAHQVICADFCSAETNSCDFHPDAGAGGGDGTGGGGNDAVGGGSGGAGGGSAAGGGGGRTGGGSGTSGWSHKNYLKALNADVNAYFGSTVAVSNDGNTLAIGAPNDWGGFSGSGAVYIFTKTLTTWTQQAYLKASNKSTSDDFGSAIAISDDGNTLAVGAPSENSAVTGINGNQADFSAPYSGAVYTFTRSGTAWTQEAYIKASNTEKSAHFGSKVTLSGDGNTLAVGAPNENSAAIGFNGDQADKSAYHSGAVYVFSRNASTWSQQTYVKPSNTHPDQRFSTVAFSGDGLTLVVGADEDSFTASRNGVVYVFSFSGGSWKQEYILYSPNPDRIDGFGANLALSHNGDTLAITVPGEASKSTGVNGDSTDNSAPHSGAVYVWSRIGSEWKQTYLKASNTEPFDSFGGSVAVSGDGNHIAVGANREDSKATRVSTTLVGQGDNSKEDSGAVYLFVRQGDSWKQEAYVKAFNTDEDDHFGSAVALDNTGKTLFVGAAQEDGRKAGSGAVYVLTR